MKEFHTNYKEFTKETLEVVDLLLSHQDELIIGWYQNHSGFRYHYNYLAEDEVIRVSNEDFWNMLKKCRNDIEDCDWAIMVFSSSLVTQLIRYQLLNRDEYFEALDYLNLSDDEYEYYFFELEGIVYAFKTKEEIVDICISKSKINGYYLIYVEFNKFGIFLTFSENQSSSLSLFWEEGMKSFRRAIGTGILTMEDIADEYVYEIYDRGDWVVDYE